LRGLPTCPWRQFIAEIELGNPKQRASAIILAGRRWALLRFDRRKALGKVEPVVAPRGPKQLGGFGEARIGEAAYRHAEHSRQAFGPEHNAGAASRAEIAVDEAARVTPVTVLAPLTSECHGGLGKEGSVGERAAAAALAVGAAARIDVERLAARADR